MKFELSNKPLSSFNYSSLTDIVLLLVIFFLLTSQFVVNTGIKVQLPGSKTDEKSIQSELAVTLTKTGEIFINAKKVDEQMLTDELIKLKKKFKKNNLIIRADKNVTIENLINVINTAKTGEIMKYTIETEKKVK